MIQLSIKQTSYIFRKVVGLASFPRNVHLHSWTGTCKLGWWQGKCAQTGTYTFTMALKLAKCNNFHKK